MRLGLTPRFCCTNSLGGNPSPPLWGTVRRGRCHSRDAAPPTPVRLTRRALEGGAGRTLDLLSRDFAGLGQGVRPGGAIPATVNGMVAAPRVQTHAGHCGNSSDAVEHGGTGRHLTCHCAPYGPTSATPSNPPEDITAVCCTPTLEATTVRVQDTP
jgi:hypothetical protein